MTKVSLRTALRSGRMVIGSWLQLGSSDIAEIMANAGFNFLVVDMEHSATGLHEAHEMIRTIDGAGAWPMVRVSENNPTYIKQVMDMGAHGVIVPMVNTVAEAKAAVAAVKYPPEGTRGVGLWRAQGYGAAFEEHWKWQEEHSVVVVQIEHIEGVQNLEAISRLPGVDGFMVGPYDLSASLGRPGQFEHPDFLAAMAEIERVVGAKRVAAGYHFVRPGWQPVSAKIAAGFTFIVYGVDFLYLGDSCRSELDVLRAHLGPRPSQT